MLDDDLEHVQGILSLGLPGEVLWVTGTIGPGLPDGTPLIGEHSRTVGSFNLCWCEKNVTETPNLGE